MLKPILAAIIFSLTPVATLAQEQEPYDYTGSTLRQQQYQIYELNRRLQVQGNQREIQMLQDRVANGGQPPKQVIVEQRTNPLVPILGAAILGGAIIYGANQNNRSYHYHHEYHRDGRRYRRNGRNYRICRDHKRRYYC